MTKDEFHNALRIMTSIDEYELVEAGITREWWGFKKNPFEWFIRASDDNADKLWTIMERRMKR